MGERELQLFGILLVLFGGLYPFESGTGEMISALFMLVGLIIGVIGIVLNQDIL